MQDYISIFRRKKRIAAVYLFGSAATGRDRKGSDLDLAIVTKKPISGRERLRIEADLSSQIPNRAKGFTLLEILIVLFIAMLMLGMGIVGFAGRLPSAKLDATVREMSALMRQARLSAKTELEKQAFVVDLDARMFGIEGKTLRQVPEEVHVRVDDSIKGPRDQGKHRVVYSPFGGVSGGVIEMKAGKRGISLKADPVLGVHVTGMRPDGW